jgi:ribosomal-protein-alanine N-acetyltransferase
MQFETIETTRLLLKGLSPEDMTTLFENNSKSKIKKILGHRTENDYQKEESKYKNGYSCYNRSFKLFLITNKTSDTIIGRCGIHNWNPEHRRAEIGYIMEDDNYKRKGLMTEALGAVIEYGFNKMNLHRIEALVGSKNIPSLKLMEKYNFIQEGLLRQHYFINNKYEDSLVFSKLYEEYSE